jgi:uncharacterized membrane protein YkvA (DUF1232 family)
MKSFDELLAEDIAEYEGRHDELIYQAPALYRLLCHLLDDAALPHRLRPMVLAAIAYFVLPADVIPEDIHGPYGYIDDIWLVAHVAAFIRDETSNPALLDHNWDGEAPLEPLIDDLLTRDDPELAAAKPKILSYIGWEELVRGAGK